MTTTPTSGAADLRATFSEMLVDLPNTEPFTLFKAGFDAALAAGQATAAQAVPPNAITASVMRDDGGEAPAFCLMAAYRSEKDAMDAFALIAAAPAQPAAQQPHRSGCTAGTDEECVQRGCGTNCPAVSPPADSVLEDAARYRFLRDGEWRDTDLEPFIRLQLNTLWDAKIDDARKQGANHGR